METCALRPAAMHRWPSTFDFFRSSGQHSAVDKPI